MLIDISPVVPMVRVEGGSHGWIYGSLVPASGKSDWVMAAVRATRPYVKASDAGLRQERIEDALLDFVQLKTEDTQQAISFLRQYGLFNQGDCVSMKGHPSDIRKYWNEATQSKQTPFATELRSFWWWQKRVLALFTLSRAPQRHHAAALRKACHEINPHIKLPPSENPIAFSKQFLSYFVSQGLAAVTLGVAPDQGKFVAVAIPADLRSALYMMLLTHLTRGTRLKNCKNTKCRRVYLVTRPDKRFCSARCQNLVKVNRFRKRRLDSAQSQATRARAGRQRSKISTHAM